MKEPVEKEHSYTVRDVIGVVARRHDTSLLTDVQSPDRRYLIIDVVDGLRRLSFLTGIDEELLPGILHCRYRKLSLEDLQVDVLEETVKFLTLASDFIMAATSTIAGGVAGFQDVATSALSLAVQTHYKVRQRLGCTTGSATNEAFDTTQDVLHKIRPILVEAGESAALVELDKLLSEINSGLQTA